MKTTTQFYSIERFKVRNYGGRYESDGAYESMDYENYQQAKECYDTLVKEITELCVNDDYTQGVSLSTWENDVQVEEVSFYWGNGIDFIDLKDENDNYFYI